MFCARLFICASWSPAGKGLTSWLSFVVYSVSLSLSHWYPGSGVVLDCIDSWSLQPYLLVLMSKHLQTSRQMHSVWNRYTPKYIERAWCAFQSKFYSILLYSSKQEVKNTWRHIWRCTVFCNFLQKQTTNRQMFSLEIDIFKANYYQKWGIYTWNNTLIIERSDRYQCSKQEAWITLISR